MHPLAKLPRSQRATEPGEWSCLQDGAECEDRAASLTIKGATACWSLGMVRACMIPVTGMAAGSESLSNYKNSKRRDLEISQ